MLVAANCLVVVAGEDLVVVAGEDFVVVAAEQFVVVAFPMDSPESKCLARWRLNETPQALNTALLDKIGAERVLVVAARSTARYTPIACNHRIHTVFHPNCLVVVASAEYEWLLVLAVNCLVVNRQLVVAANCLWLLCFGSLTKNGLAAKSFFALFGDDDEIENDESICGDEIEIEIESESEIEIVEIVCVSFCGENDVSFCVDFESAIATNWKTKKRKTSNWKTTN